jgi:Mrp family chromosome partitioning ATPase
MVVSSNKTHLDLIDKAKKVFEAANTKISGVIVNKADIKGSSYYSYYYNDYYGEKE